MAYNDYISRDDADGLIPDEFAQEILGNMADTFWLMNISRRLRDMSTRVRTMPVKTALAAAGFVSGDTGLKQTSKVSWEGKNITAEEIAVIVAVPDAVVADIEDGMGYDLWGGIKKDIEEALSVVLTEAVLYGTDIPTSWTTDLGAAGLVALATAASQTVSLAGFTDQYEAILGESADAAADGVLAMLEADGFQATQHVAHVGIKTMLRNCRDANGLPIFPSVNDIEGVPVLYPNDGSISSTNKMLSGDWSNLVWSMRQDITYKVLDQAVITDAAGNIIWNFAQQDMSGLRCVMRIGFAAPNPINRMQETEASRCPWVVTTA
ncbi:MAG TPA: phage major capsid protein [Armatimonadota bacterium]|nr:phage major capsid protein [Armatimonadota bacterium]